jgi:hypothetical protein
MGHIPSKSLKPRFYPQISLYLKIFGYPHFLPYIQKIHPGSYSQDHQDKELYIVYSTNHIHNLIPSYYLSCKGHSIKGLIYPIKASFKAYIINTPIIAPP